MRLRDYTPTPSNTHPSSSLQLEVQQQLPCQFKFEDKAPSHSCRDTDLLDGHGFSSLEKLRMCSGQAALTAASTQLSRYDTDVTESSSEEDVDEDEDELHR